MTTATPARLLLSRPARALGAVVAVLLLGLALLAVPAYAGDDGDVFNSSPNGNSQGVGGQHGDQGHGGSGGTSSTSDGGGGGPVGPVYEYYYTPACSVNGPPDQDGQVYNGDAMCMGAVSGCPEGQIRMFGYRRIAGSHDSWDNLGTACRGGDEAGPQQPQVTAQMVFDYAEQQAPRPTVNVQPGNRSFVNIPNNYWADAPDTDPTVTVLGQQIQLHFYTTEVTWDFGDGGSATGEGVEGADPGTAGAVEHGYRSAGTYPITATTTVGIRFTLPDGQRVDVPDQFSMTSPAVDLPVGEIQTKVDDVG